MFQLLKVFSSQQSDVADVLAQASPRGSWDWDPPWRHPDLPLAGHADAMR